jgi:hypothetical protein
MFGCALLVCTDFDLTLQSFETALLLFASSSLCQSLN